MFLSDSVSEVKDHFEKACNFQSTLYPAECNSKDCRFCYLSRMKNTAIRRLEAMPKMVSITINGSVTINGNVTIR